MTTPNEEERLRDEIRSLHQLIEIKRDKYGWPVDHKPVATNAGTLMDANINWESGQVLLSTPFGISTFQIQKMHIKDLINLINCFRLKLQYPSNSAPTTPNSP